MKNVLCFVALFAAAASSAAPTVTVTSVVANGPGVKVNYTLAGDPAVITLSLSAGDVALSDADLSTVGGDVNGLVQPGSHTIAWTPDPNRATTQYDAGALKAAVKAWPVDCPPDYMVVDLVYTNGVRYYTSTNAFPHPISDSRYKTDYLVMRKIPAAGVVWRMGSPTDEASRVAAEEASRYVRLDSDYYIGIYELTEGQFYRVYRQYNSGTAGQNAFRAKINDGTNPDEYPFCCYAYVNIRGGKDQSPNKVWPTDGHTLPAASKSRCWIGYFRTRLGIDFDLPTDPQWEFACRGGAEGASAPADLATYAWYKVNSPTATTLGTICFPHPVGTKAPNGFGLYDMLGNAEEYVLDYYATVTQPDDPANTVVSETELQIGNGGSNKTILRGGSYSAPASACRPARRSGDVWTNWNFAPSGYDSSTGSTGVGAYSKGFRLACPARAVR